MTYGRLRVSEDAKREANGLLPIVKESLLHNALEIVDLEIQETGKVPTYCYSLQVESVQNESKGDFEFLYIHIRVIPKDNWEEDSDYMTKSAMVVFKGSFIWELHSKNVSWLET